MQRAEMYARFRARSGRWDMIMVGGGATGVGVAIDAAARGYGVLLLEQHDFGKGTSSRSTKLVHGGVRYLEQGNISLVMEALRERGLLLANAPHLVHDRGFVVPNYDWWEAPFYGLGLKVYNLLAGKYGFGASRILSKEETLERLPTIKTEGLRGGVIYFDGQFDDSRLLIDMAATAYEMGATLLNYVRVTGLTKDAEGFIDGVIARGAESGEEFHAQAEVVINATGPFTDDLRRQADASITPIIAPSQGVHLVFDRSFLPGESAIMVPHTSDGRVMFAIPWHGHTLIGTTDTPVDGATLEPVAMEQEIDFILSTASLYLAHKPTRGDILSVFAHLGDHGALDRNEVKGVLAGSQFIPSGGKRHNGRRQPGALHLSFDQNHEPVVNRGKANHISPVADVQREVGPGGYTNAPWSILKNKHGSGLVIGNRSLDADAAGVFVAAISRQHFVHGGGGNCPGIGCCAGQNFHAIGGTCIDTNAGLLHFAIEQTSRHAANLDLGIEHVLWP